MKAVNSYKEQIDGIFLMQSIITNESNPFRSWQINNLEVFTDKQLIPLNENVFYLYEFYEKELENTIITDEYGKESNLLNELFYIEDFFGGWIDTFLNGNTSIYNMLNVYTVENLEKKIKHYANVINLANEIRLNWIDKNSVNKNAA